jgi:2-hydroxy-3-oxopropionate reductase
VLEVHVLRMIERTFDPGFRIRLHQKDLALALDGAKALGVSLPNTASTQQLFSAVVARGGGDRDHSAIVQALELLADAQVSQGNKG